MFRIRCGLETAATFCHIAPGQNPSITIPSWGLEETASESGRCKENRLKPVLLGDLAVDGYFFAGVLGAVVCEVPGGHFLGLAVGDTDDDVAVPGPSVLTVVLAGARGVIGMGVIPANQLQAAF